jgi:2-octaprenylphenol hydroxylase (EC 1.14.13.-)
MLWEMLNAARDLGRVHDIASVLIRYGFGSFVRGLGMGKALERAGRVLHWQHVEDYVQLDTPQRVRRVLEELGPTFIKLGKSLRHALIYSRPNILPSLKSFRTRCLRCPLMSCCRSLKKILAVVLMSFFHTSRHNRLPPHPLPRS